MQRIFFLALYFATVLCSFAAVTPERLESARKLYNERKNDEAFAAFDALRKEDANEPEPWFYLGLVVARRDDAEGSASYIEKAVALRPNNAEYSRRLGDAYGRAAQKAGTFSKIGWARKSRAAYERAVELDPKSVEARSSLMGYYMQAPGIVGGGMDKAHAQADEIMRLNPAIGRISKASLYLREKKFDEAFGVHEAILAGAPNDYNALYQYGRIAAESGQRLERGAANLRRCLEMPPPDGAPGRAPTHWRLGMILEKSGDTAGARAAYEAAVKEDPNLAAAVEALSRL